MTEPTEIDLRITTTVNGVEHSLAMTCTSEDQFLRVLHVISGTVAMFDVVEAIRDMNAKINGG